MRIFSLRCLFLAVPMASVFAQTPALQMNIVYVCTDGQSFKVFSCDNTTGACDYQNYKKGQAYQRGEALRVQLVALLPAKCHAQTPAEAQADPHRGEIPPAPSPFKARASAGSNGSGSTDSGEFADQRTRRVQGRRHRARSDRRLAGSHVIQCTAVLTWSICAMGLTFQNSGRSKCVDSGNSRRRITRPGNTISTIACKSGERPVDGG